MCVCVYACACVRACVRVCVRARLLWYVSVCVCGVCVVVYGGGGGDCSVCISAVLWNSTDAFHLLHNASVSSAGNRIGVGTRLIHSHRRFKQVNVHGECVRNRNRYQDRCHCAPIYGWTADF